MQYGKTRKKVKPSNSQQAKSTPKHTQIHLCKQKTDLENVIIHLSCDYLSFTEHVIYSIYVKDLNKRRQCCVKP